MSTNYNQLLKDLEIGSVYVKILICFLGCTFMLYPFLFYFTHFFRELSVSFNNNNYLRGLLYEQEL